MIKKSLLILFFYVLFFQTTLANNYIEKSIDWYKFRLIKYDTKSKDYIFKIWVNLDYSATSLRELMETNNWVSAINWVFFCPDSYRECGWKNFTKNERYLEWKKIWPELKTWDRVVFAIDKNNHSFLYQTDKINKQDENKIYYWYANFPLLLEKWISKFQDYVDLWLIDNKMKAKMQRNFICNDKTNRYIYNWYVSEIELDKLPELLIKFWCYDALNLDAWYSSAMIYNAKSIIWPSRDIMDWVIIERKGLDTSKIRENWVKIQKFVENKIVNNALDEKYIYLDNLITALWNIKTDIYNKNSHDIFENWNKIWYEINVKDINKLQTVYMANYLRILFYESKQMYEEQERQRVEKENNIKNKEWLLF